ncbi:MAG TPA: tyrosine-type recombinase/integrase [Candidatus Acidoferrales bacterium]|nr:tyrosine-type recombinase/integrase [Candidatus Acidoferrales bacterium]
MGLSLFFTGEGFEIDQLAYPGLPLFIDPQTMRIEHLPTEWIIFQAVIRGSSRSPGTWRNYAFGLLDWLQYSDANGWDWRSPEERLLAHYRNALECRKPILSSKTIARKMLVVCWFYEWAKSRGHLRNLPVAFEARGSNIISRRLLAHLNTTSTSVRRVLVPRRSARERIPRFFTKSEQELIFNHLSMRDRLMVLWALNTGVRESELCALTVDQIPEQDGYRATRLYRLRLQVTKGSIGGDLYVPTWLLDETYRYVSLFERRTVARNARKRGNSEPSAIWLSRWGKPLRPNSIYQNFKQAVEKSGIQPGTFHDLRHTYAITMLDRLTRTAANDDARARNPLLVLRHLMRHTTLASTEIYLRAREFYLSDIFQDAWDVPEVR